MGLPLVIIGAIGNCIDILDAVLAINSSSNGPTFELLGFLDDDAAKQGMQIGNYKILGPLVMAGQLDNNASFINGIGSIRSYLQKKDLIESLGLAPNRFATVIHPLAAVASSSKIGRGTVILANTTICANAQIGEQVMISPNCVVGHDVIIDDYSILSAGVTISGAALVGQSCYLGSNVSVYNYVKIKPQTLISMGTTVFEDIPQTEAQYSESDL